MPRQPASALLSPFLFSHRRADDSHVTLQAKWKLGPSRGASRRSNSPLPPFVITAPAGCHVRRCSCVSNRSASASPVCSGLRGKDKVARLPSPVAPHFTSASIFRQKAFAPGARQVAARVKLAVMKSRQVNADVVQVLASRARGVPHFTRGGHKDWVREAVNVTEGRSLAINLEA